MRVRGIRSRTLDSGAPMSSADVARRYFEALAARDVESAVALWAAGGIERVVGQRELTAPAGVREFQNELFGAIPDLRWEVLDSSPQTATATARSPSAGARRARSPARGLPGLHAQRSADRDRGLRRDDGRRRRADQHNDAYVDGADIARQLGLLPPAGSQAEAGLTTLANARTRLRTASTAASRADRRGRVARPRRRPAGR